MPFRRRARSSAAMASTRPPAGLEPVWSRPGVRSSRSSSSRNRRRASAYSPCTIQNPPATFDVGMGSGSQGAIFRLLRRGVRDTHRHTKHRDGVGVQPGRWRSRVRRRASSALPSCLPANCRAAPRRCRKRSMPPWSRNRRRACLAVRVAPSRRLTVQRVASVMRGRSQWCRLDVEADARVYVWPVHCFVSKGPIES
jgi:hypothetical protein